MWRAGLASIEGWVSFALLFGLAFALSRRCDYEIQATDYETTSAAWSLERRLSRVYRLVRSCFVKVFRPAGRKASPLRYLLEPRSTFPAFTLRELPPPGGRRRAKRFREMLP